MDTTDPVKVLVTMRENSPQPGVLTTPGPREANVQVVEQPMWKRIMVRALRTSAQVFLGSFTSINAVEIVSGQALPKVMLLLVTVGATFIYAAVHNWVELTARWDETRPGLRS